MVLLKLTTILLQGKYLHLHLADVYEKSNNFAGALEMFEKTLKKVQYKKSKKVWMAFHSFLLRHPSIGTLPAKQALSRSLQSLSKHKHIEVIKQYALAEYDFGSVSNGREVFQELLATYVKRTDIWNVFIDREVKCGNIDYSRRLFDQLIASKLNVKAMKSVFKKYLSFEVQYGNSDGQEHVKSKAKEYVSSLA